MKQLHSYIMKISLSYTLVIDRFLSILLISDILKVLEMLNKAKYIMKMNSTQLANFLEISPPTLRNWEKNKIWPLWALEKCGVMNNKDEQTIQKIKEMLNEY